MKPAPHFLPPRQQVIYAITRRMLDETAMNANTFAMVVAELYLELTAPDVRTVPMKLGEGDELLAAMKNNGQILRRYMDGTVKVLPADLEDAWVLALPDAYRDECELMLARRRGRLSVVVPDDCASEGAEAMAQVMANAGELCSGWARSLADGVIDRTEQLQILNSSDGVIASVLRFRAHVLKASPRG